MKMPHWPVPLGSKPIDLDLNRIQLLLSELGSPQDTLPPIIHIAGTNGKGSTLAFLRSIFQAAHYKVHTYTSPHLVNFNERIGILGCDIEDNFLYEITEECRLAAEKLNLPVTFFEGTTAAAFLAFSRVEADVILLEVGMGGRLDATNVITNPAMSIITSISIDHTDFLGNNLIEIAFEKASIIKPNCPSIISCQYPEVMEFIHKIALQRNSSCEAFEYDWIIEPGLYQCKEKSIKLPKLSILGGHQYLNAGNAITAALKLTQFNITDEHIINGLANAKWPARLELLKDGSLVNKLPKDWQIWVDGAHNDAGAQALSMWLENEPTMPTYLIMGMTKGRDCKAFLSPFIKKIDHVIGMLIEAEPSSYSGEFVSHEASSLGLDSTVCESIEEAIHTISAFSKTPARILVCGSLYLAGDVLRKNIRGLSSNAT